MRLYHGTDEIGYQGIQKTGTINGPVYLTPDFGVARMYGRDHVISVEIDISVLKIDFDLPGGKLLDIESANVYSEHADWTINDYIENGYSVGVENSVTLAGSLK